MSDNVDSYGIAIKCHDFRRVQLTFIINGEGIAKNDDGPTLPKKLLKVCMHACAVMVPHIHCSFS